MIAKSISAGIFEFERRIIILSFENGLELGMEFSKIRSSFSVSMPTTGHNFVAKILYYSLHSGWNYYISSETWSGLKGLSPFFRALNNPLSFTWDIGTSPSEYSSYNNIEKDHLKVKYSMTYFTKQPTHHYFHRISLEPWLRSPSNEGANDETLA